MAGGTAPPPQSQSGAIGSRLGVFGANEALAQHIGVTCAVGAYWGKLADRAPPGRVAGGERARERRAHTHTQNTTEGGKTGKARFGRLLSMPCPIAENELSLERARRGGCICGPLRRRQPKGKAHMARRGVREGRQRKGRARRARDAEERERSHDTVRAGGPIPKYTQRDTQGGQTTQTWYVVCRIRPRVFLVCVARGGFPTDIEMINSEGGDPRSNTHNTPTHKGTQRRQDG